MNGWSSLQDATLANEEAWIQVAGLRFTSLPWIIYAHRCGLFPRRQTQWW